MPSVFSLPTFWTWCLLFWRGLFHCLFLQQNSLCLNWECPLCCFILFLFLLLCKVRWSHSVVSAQSCPTLCNPVDCKLLGFSVHGILQARILEWIAVFFSRGSSRPRDWTRVSLIVDRRLTVWAIFSKFCPRADPCHFLLNQLARAEHMDLPLQESLVKHIFVW